MIICRIQDSRFTNEDVVELIKASFVQWQERGLESSLSQLTPDSFAMKTTEATVLLAIDEINNILLGTTSFSVQGDKQGKRYAYNKFSAVISTTKHNGIGSSLLQYEKKCAINENCHYIISDTSVHAKWSVKWHKKNGFRIIGLKSFYNNDYYSYIFRLELKDASIWSSSLYCNVRFFISWLKTRLMFNFKGNNTLIGSVVIKIIRLLKLWKSI